MAEEETSSRSAPGATDRNAFRRRPRAVNGKRPPGSRGKCRAGVDPVSPYKGAAVLVSLLLCGLSWTLFLWQRLSESVPV